MLFWADSTETLMHLFGDCRSTQTFWNNVSQWTSENLDLTRQSSRAHTVNRPIYNRAHKDTSSLYDRADHRYPAHFIIGLTLVPAHVSLFFFNRAHTDTRSLQNRAHRHPLTSK